MSIANSISALANSIFEAIIGIKGLRAEVKQLNGVAARLETKVDAGFTAIRWQIDRRADRLESLQVETVRLLNELLVAVLPAPATSIGIEYVLENGTKVGQGMLSLRSGQTAAFRVIPRDAAGNKTTLDGPATVEIADSSILVVEGQAEDGLSGTIRAVGPVTDPDGEGVQISISGDGDLGEGVTALNGTDMVKVTPGNAVAVSFEFDAPQG